MGLLDELKQLLKTAAEQLTYSRKAGPQTSTSSKEVNFSYKAKQWGLSEKDALDLVMLSNIC